MYTKVSSNFPRKTNGDYEERFYKSSTTLFDWLLRDAVLFAKSNNLSSLLIIPDGILSAIPFSALIDPDKKVFLNTIMDISYYYSGSALLSNFMNRPLNENFLSASGYAPLTFKSLPPIAGDEVVMNGIGLEAKDKHFENNCSKTNLLNDAAENLILYTHYDHQKKELYLSNSDYISITQIGNNGLQPHNLLFLYCCQVVDASDIATAEGPINPIRYFLAGGSKNIVAPLFNLNASSTDQQELLTVTYNSISHTPRGKSASQCLQEIINDRLQRKGQTMSYMDLFNLVFYGR
jgi:CHAT domain-containing protein